jgi:hypothetical protein
MRLTSIIIILALFNVFSRLSYAQVDPCEKDRAKFCAQYGAKDPLRLYCLKSIESQITPACKASLRNIKGTDTDFIEECTPDYHKFCTATPKGQGRVLECLRGHSKELDFECRKKVNMLPKHEVR